MNVPILGQGEPVKPRQPTYAPVEAENQSDLTRAFQVYDHEVLKIEKVLERLRQRASSRRVLDDFDREARQRFEDIGFVVKINWYETNVEGTFMPEIEVVGRTERHDFDHDRMVHEVTGDLLETGNGGVIKSGEFLKPEKHEH